MADLRPEDVPAAPRAVTTSALPTEVQGIFARTIPTGVAHGTVTVLVPPAQAHDPGEPRPRAAVPIEVTTFRGEGAYSDARHPDHVVFGVSLEEDLARRDFTINAMAYDPVAATIVDPHGGRADLAARLLRAVGDPAARFREDGLRVLRALRFAAVLELDLDPATEAAIPSALPSLARVSAERVRDELLKLLAARQPSRGLRIAERTGVIALLLPELAACVGLSQNHFHRHDVWEHTLATVDAIEGDALRRLGALLHDIGKPPTRTPKEDAPGEFAFFRHEHAGAGLADEVLRRLKLPTRDRTRVVAMIAQHMFWYEPTWTDATVRRFIRRVGEENLADLFALRSADVIAHGMGADPADETGELSRRIAAVLAADQALHITDLAVDGGDVMRTLGVPPGRVIGEVLATLLEMVIEDPSLNQRQRLLELIPQVVKGR